MAENKETKVTDIYYLREGTKAHPLRISIAKVES